MNMAMHPEAPSAQPAVAAARTVDRAGSVASLRQKGLFGNEDDILSIIEGRPSEKVMNDVEEYIIFHKTGADPAQLDSKTILDYYLQWNNMDIDENQLLAFSISES